MKDSNPVNSMAILFTRFELSIFFSFNSLYSFHTNTENTIINGNG